MTLRPARPRRLRVRSLLLLVVLVPTLGMTAMAASTAHRAFDDRRVAQQVQRRADTLADIIDARLAVGGEEAQSSVLSIAADLGISVETLSDLYGIDYRAEMRKARTVVDDNLIFTTLPALAGQRRDLRALRIAIDAGTATYEDVRAGFADMTSKLDRVWRARLAELQTTLASEEVAGVLHARANDLRPTFDALTWGGQRASASIELLRKPPDPDAVARLLDATSRYRSATESFTGRLGPRATAAWSHFQANPAARRFDLTLTEISETYLTGRTSPLAADPGAFGDAFVDGTPWAAGLTRIVRAAAADLREEAGRQERGATEALRDQLAAAALLTMLSVAGALLLARILARPVRRLQVAAHAIHEGNFDLDPLETVGPREISDTAVAFNEMATTLAAVEAHAVALVDDPDAPFLGDQLPGKTGLALQVALNRLRASIRSAEQHRRELEDAATHDGLTGLLNRTAALAMIERDLAQAGRANGIVMALFVDLDDLKPINDQHGHAAGDDALRLTAEALRASTRRSDVVARLGGDEFLVASVVADRLEVELLAERIRAAVAEQELFGRAGRIPLHCSVGMATSGPGADSVDALIHRADSASLPRQAGGRRPGGMGGSRDRRRSGRATRQSVTGRVASVRSGRRRSGSGRSPWPGTRRRQHP